MVYEIQIMDNSVWNMEYQIGRQYDCQVKNQIINYDKEIWKTKYDKLRKNIFIY